MLFYKNAAGYEAGGRMDAVTRITFSTEKNTVPSRICTFSRDSHQDPVNMLCLSSTSSWTTEETDEPPRRLYSDFTGSINPGTTQNLNSMNRVRDLPFPSSRNALNVPAG